MTPFSPGDRTRTPTNRLGTVLPPPWTMPLHVLVRIDGMDNPIWLLSSILTLEARAQPKPEPEPEPQPIMQIAQLSLFSEDAAA